LLVGLARIGSSGGSGHQSTSTAGGTDQSPILAGAINALLAALIEVPSFGLRMKCSKCGGKRVDVRSIGVTARHGTNDGSETWECSLLAWLRNSGVFCALDSNRNY
jgi:hypothetical protein